MRDVLGPGSVLGYCTNVHPGRSVEHLLATLEQHSLAVRQRVCPDAAMGIGLWLPATAARELAGENRVQWLADWLRERGLEVFTLNGFPFGDFHRPSVKHAVYQPDWSDPRRLRYTLDLVTILAGLLSDDAHEGSISTLPIGWRGTARPSQSGVSVPPTATENLLTVVDHLATLEQRTGKLIHLDLEPEPGCVLDISGDVADLFADHLDPSGDAEQNRRYLRVCHDVCHSAVMFEDQAEAFERYRAWGIRIGKVQLSSAIAVDLDNSTATQCAKVIDQLHGFAEARYLHQTAVRTLNPAGEPVVMFYDDLPEAIDAWRRNPVPGGRWRVHHHVPLFLDSIGGLQTTQRQIIEALALCRAGGVHHYEVETYAWGVLPDEVRTTTLADGIARELAWVLDRVPAENVT